MPYTFALSGHRKPSVGAVSSSASSGVMVRVDIGAPTSETTAEDRSCRPEFADAAAATARLRPPCPLRAMLGDRAGGRRPRGPSLGQLRRDVVTAN